MANYYKFTLKANQAVTVPIAGKVILVDSLGAAPGLDITPVYQGQTGITMPQRQTAFKVWVDYDNVVLAAPVDCTVALFLSASDVSLGFTNGSNINVQGQVAISNGPGDRVPVDLAGGTVTVTADQVGISNDNTKPVPVQKQALATFTHNTAPVGAAAAQVVADPTLKRLVLKNASTGGQTIYLGGATVTAANAAISLAPGDMWDDDISAGATWFAAASAAGAQLNIMGVKP